MVFRPTLKQRDIAARVLHRINAFVNFHQMTARHLESFFRKHDAVVMSPEKLMATLAHLGFSMSVEEVRMTMTLILLGCVPFDPRPTHVFLIV